MWEYYILECHDSNIELEHLNKLGEKKWELVSTIKDNTCVIFYFKRPKQ